MRRAAPLLLLALAACGPRPPRGMARLDSGGMNRACVADARLRHLYCISGKEPFASQLVVVRLSDGRERRYGFSRRRLVVLRPSDTEDSVAVGAEIIRVDERFRPSEPVRRVLMSVGAEDGRVLEERETEDLGAKPPAEPEAAIVEEPAPGIRTVFGADRVARFFPTPSAPGAVARGERGDVYAAYREKKGRWALERLDAATGARRPLNHFKGEIESLALWDNGIVLLRRESGDKGPRALSLVEADSGWVALELPWSDGLSQILGVDGARKKL